jgi:hypothetical protein
MILLAVFLLGGKGKSGGKDGKHTSNPKDFVSRATQPRAKSWVPYFQDVGETPASADALSRWTGLESGGDPTIVSSLGERGLLQVGKQTQAEGGIDAADWAALTNPDTLPNEHARIASGYAAWLFSRALKHLPQSAASIDPTDKAWFAYEYHQRPKDFTQWGELPGDAKMASAYLLGRAHLNGDKNLEKRVSASNVVAFGTPDSPIPPMVSGGEQQYVDAWGTRDWPTQQAMVSGVAAVYTLTPPNVIPEGTRLYVDMGDGAWHAGSVEPTGYSVTLDDSGDSVTLYTFNRHFRYIPRGAS